MIRFMLAALVVLVALLVAPFALAPGFNSADGITVAAPFALVGIYLTRPVRRRLRAPRPPAEHPDALGSLDLLERAHQPWRRPPTT